MNRGSQIRHMRVRTRVHDAQCTELMRPRQDSSHVALTHTPPWGGGGKGTHLEAGMSCCAAPDTEPARPHRIARNEIQR
jgi:hypothetical protein